MNLDCTGSLDPDDLARAKRTEDKRLLGKTYRFDIPLDLTGARYEYNFLTLVAQEEAKVLDAAKSAFDPVADDCDAETAALVKRLEEKYNKVSSGIRKRKQLNKCDDYADLGYGYDSNDTFIDNTDQYDEMIPEDVTTMHGGFYINSGLLEFRVLETLEDSFVAESAKKTTGVKRRKKEENNVDEMPKKKKTKKLKATESEDKPAIDSQKKKRKKQMPAMAMATPSQSPGDVPSVPTKMKETIATDAPGAAAGSLVVNPAVVQGNMKKVQKPRKPKATAADISNQSECSSVISATGDLEEVKKPKKPRKPKSTNIAPPSFETTDKLSGVTTSTPRAASNRASEGDATPRRDSEEIIVVDPVVIEVAEVKKAKNPRKPKAPKANISTVSGQSECSLVVVPAEKKKIAKPRKPKSNTSTAGQTEESPAVHLNGEVKKATKPRKPKVNKAPATAKTEDNPTDTSDIIILEAYTVANSDAPPEQTKKARKPRKPKVANQSLSNSVTVSLPGASSTNSLADFQPPAAKPKKARVKAAPTANGHAALAPASALANNITTGNVSVSRKRPAAEPFVCMPKLPKVANPLLANSGAKPKNPLLSQANQSFSLPKGPPIRPVARPHSLPFAQGQLVRSPVSAQAVQRLVASTPRAKAPLAAIPNFSPKESQVHPHVLDYQMRIQQQPNQAPAAGFARPRQRVSNEFKGVAAASRAAQPKAAAKQKLARASSLTSVATQNGARRFPTVMLGNLKAAAVASLHKLPNGLTVTSSKGSAQLQGTKQTKANKQTQNARPSNMLNNSSSF